MTQMEEMLKHWAWSERDEKVFQITDVKLVRHFDNTSYFRLKFRGDHTCWMYSATYIGNKKECEAFENIYLQRKEEKRITNILNTKEYIV